MENKGKVKGGRIGRMELVYERMVKIQEEIHSNGSSSRKREQNTVSTDQMVSFRSSGSKWRWIRLINWPVKFINTGVPSSLLVFLAPYTQHAWGFVFLSSGFDQPTHTLVDPVVTSCHLTIVSQLIVASWLPGGPNTTCWCSADGGLKPWLCGLCGVRPSWKNFALTAVHIQRVWRDTRMGEVFGLVSRQVL